MKPLKIGAYIRVSTEDQVNTFEGSLESQKYRIQEFVEYKNRQNAGWGDLVEYYVEEGISAGTTNRPMYQKIMSDIRKGKVNLILVSDLTRLSRNLLDFCNLINELERHKASYLSMKEQFDTSTPIGRMMVFIIIALGQFEREQTSERVSVNCHSRAVRGLMNGGPAPLGYDKNPDKKGLLVINEHESEIVRTIFKTFLECGSRAQTILKLKEMGIRPKRNLKKAQSRGPADWTVQSLGSLLNHAAYIGQREVNRLYQDEDPAHLKPWQKYQMVKASWSPIIDERLYFEAQKLLEEASASERTRVNSGEKRFFLLTGLLNCGETGLPLMGQAGHGSGGTIHRYYHYARRPKDLKTVRPRLSADELEEKLIVELKSALSTAGYFNDLEKLLKSQSEAKNKNSESEFNRAERELNDVTQRITTIWTNQGRMHLSVEALTLASDELNRLAKQKADLEKYISSLNRKEPSLASIKEQSLFVENQIRALSQGWSKATPPMRKRLLRRTVKEIVVAREEMQITFWLSAQERDESLFDGSESDPKTTKKILAFRGKSPQSQDQNQWIKSSGEVRNGRGCRT
jgi:DNA invertase Pin-like site-specific DNA recombinase/transposase